MKDLSRFVMSPQEKFHAEQTVVELAELLPATDYSVTLYALYDEDPSDPVTAVATTCKSLTPPLFLTHYSLTTNISDTFALINTSPHSPSSTTNERSVSHGHPQYAEGELGARSQ